MADPRAVFVAESGTGKFQNTVDVGPHRWTADEPASLGGDDAGPNPYDMLLAALGACTSMTVRMYAERKGWKLEKVRVALTHKKSHLKDCEDCESTTANFVDEIEREIEFVGELDDDQCKRLMEIADKCPVHRTLHENLIKIRTRHV